jgi:transposase
MIQIGHFYFADDGTFLNCFDSRAKTDKADAKLIARYALSAQPPLWMPPPAIIRELQAMTRRVGHLVEMIQMGRNRLDTADKSIVESIKKSLAFLEAELKAARKAINNHIKNNPELKQRSDLLDTIPGV